MLNGAVRDNVVFTKPIFTKPIFGNKFQSPDCIHKKRKLNASNIAFLQSLGFAVRNV